MLVKHLFSVASLLIVAQLASSCAVGPNFQRPAPPDIERYTAEPLASHTASAPVADGQAQRFDQEKDVSGQWWRMFRSRPLNNLVDEALQHNPNLDATRAALRVAQEMTYAQYGAFFPLIQANYIPSRQQVPTTVLSSPLAVRHHQQQRCSICKRRRCWCPIHSMCGA